MIVRGQGRGGATLICRSWMRRAVRLAEILAADRAEPFDMACPPLLRFRLLRLGGDRHRLVITSHHILMDGWSSPVLVQELLALYAHGGMMVRCRG